MQERAGAASHCHTTIRKQCSPSPHSSPAGRGRRPAMAADPPPIRVAHPILLRALLWLFSRTCYRVTALNPDNVPGKGGALLVSNHVSFVDMLLILASTRRFVRFL